MDSKHLARKEKADPLDQILSARMANLAEMPQQGSIVEPIKTQLDQEMDQRTRLSRQWVLLAAAAMSTMIVLSVLPEIGLALGEVVGVYFSGLSAGLSETLTTLRVNVSQPETVTPFIWLIVLVPASLLLTTEW